MRIRGVVSTVIVLVMGVLAGCKSTSQALPPDEVLPPSSSASPPPAVDPDPWPRHVETGAATLLVYSPQLESWQGNLLKYPIPKIIVSYAPSILIPVDGAPALRKLADHRFERVINSRALIVREEHGSVF